MPSNLDKIKKVLSYVTPFRTLVAICCVYLFLTTCYFILAALSNALNMDTYAANGTFQLYNPLRRLLEGQIIGKDFPFFHGVGVPLLHYPAFYALGHNVFAADAVKWLVSPIVFLLTSYTFFWAFFRKASHSIIATAMLTVLALVCIDVVWPGNSLVGIRTSLPVLVAAFMLWRPKLILHLKGYTFSLYQPIVFILLALAVAMGTEQGLAAIIAYMLVEVIRAIRSPIAIKHWWWRIALKGVGVLATTYVVLSILTLGHANEALRYALIDIPKDQGWYFGAPPNDFLAWNTLHYILDSRVVVYLAPIIILGGIVMIFDIKRGLMSARESYIFGFLVFYGLIVFFASIMGYWAPNAQLIPLTRAFGVILIAVCVRIILRYFTQQNNRKKKIRRYLPLVIYAILIISMGWYALLAYKQIQPFPVIQVLKDVKNARHAPDGTYTSLLWKQRIQAFAPYIPEGATVWSTYTGLYDSMRGQLNSSTGGEDYIIHALGPERRQQYSDSFVEQDPDFAITLKSSYFWYEEWLWGRHWPFYKELQTHYKIIADNDSHILWQRQENTPLSPPDQATVLEPTPDGSYQFSPGRSDRIRVYEITVNYTVRKPIPLGDKMSRYLMTISGSSAQRFPTALPPYETSWQFPVVLTPSDTVAIITPGTYGLALKSYLEVSSVAYKEVPIDSTNGYIYYDSYCAFGGTLVYPELGSQYHHLRCPKGQLSLEFYQSQPATELFVRPAA